MTFETNPESHPEPGAPDYAQEELVRQIEDLFASVTSESLRFDTRKLEQLVRQIKHARTRSQYEAAIDQLPDIVTHENTGSP